MKLLFDREQTQWNLELEHSKYLWFIYDLIEIFRWNLQEKEEISCWSQNSRTVPRLQINLIHQTVSAQPNKPSKVHPRMFHVISLKKVWEVISRIYNASTAINRWIFTQTKPNEFFLSLCLPSFGNWKVGSWNFPFTPCLGWNKIQSRRGGVKREKRQFNLISKYLLWKRKEKIKEKKISSNFPKICTFFRLRRVLTLLLLFVSREK